MIPSSDADWAAISKVLERFGELFSAAHKGVAVRLAPASDDLAEIVRALDAGVCRVANVQLHAPTLDDVFLGRRAARSAGAAEEPEEARRRARAAASGVPGVPARPPSE